MTTILAFADRPIPVKQLTLGTVVFRCLDSNDKLNPEHWEPVHVVGFGKNIMGEIILLVRVPTDDLINTKEVAIHPGNCVFGSDF